MEKQNIFKPEQNLMSALFNLDNETDAKQWYKEYLAFHKGKDQGIHYVINYFTLEKSNQLREWLFD